MSAIINLTDANFDEEIQKISMPMLIDFYAPWCGPCQGLAPILDELSSEYAGRLVIAKINIDENKAITSRFVVRSVPTMIFVKADTEERRLVGMLPKSELKAAIDQFIE